MRRVADPHDGAPGFRLRRAHLSTIAALIVCATAIWSGVFKIASLVSVIESSTAAQNEDHRTTQALVTATSQLGGRVEGLAGRIDDVRDEQGAQRRELQSIEAALRTRSYRGPLELSDFPPPAKR